MQVILTEQEYSFLKAQEEAVSLLKKGAVIVDWEYESETIVLKGNDAVEHLRDVIEHKDAQIENLNQRLSQIPNWVKNIFYR